MLFEGVTHLPLCGVGEGGGEFHWDGSQLGHGQVLACCGQLVSPFPKPPLRPPCRGGAAHSQHDGDGVTHVQGLLDSVHLWAFWWFLGGCCFYVFRKLDFQSTIFKLGFSKLNFQS